MFNKFDPWDIDIEITDIGFAGTQKGQKPVSSLYAESLEWLFDVQIMNNSPQNIRDLTVETLTTVHNSHSRIGETEVTSIYKDNYYNYHTTVSINAPLLKEQSTTVRQGANSSIGQLCSLPKTETWLKEPHNMDDGDIDVVIFDSAPKCLGTCVYRLFGVLENGEKFCQFRQERLNSISHNGSMLTNYRPGTYDDPHLLAKDIKKLLKDVFHL